MTVDSSHEALTPLGPKEQAICDEWYEFARLNSLPGLTPSLITAGTQERFARRLHKLVADEISLTRLDWNPISEVVDREATEANLTYYFRWFPPDSTDPTLLARKEAYQDEGLTVAKRHVGVFREVDVAFALRRAFRDRQQRDATRATFGLITAYGHTLKARTPIPFE